MNQSHSDDLPPELDELGRRMSDERPAADGHTLDRVMTRAQGARTRKSSLLWRSSAPRTPKKTIALVIAAIFATGGMATAANANLLGNLLGGNGLLSQLLGTGGPATGNCTGNGLIAIGAGIGSDCSGSSSSSSSSSSSGGSNCTATGGIAIGLSVLSNCTGGGSGPANCSAAGGIALGVSILSDCSRGDAAATQYEEELGANNCSATGLVALGVAILADCSSNGDDD